MNNSPKGAFVCPRCGDDFNRKDTLINHLNKKNTCLPTIANVTTTKAIEDLSLKHYNEKTFDCEYCKQKFNHSSAKYRHKKTCKAKDKTVQESTPASTVSTASASTSTSMSSLPSSNIQLDITTLNHNSSEDTNDVRKELEALKAMYFNDITKLKEQIDSLKNIYLNTNTNTNNTQNIYIQNNVIIKSFGEEDLSHLTSDFLSHCLLNPTKGLPSLIELIHYDKSKPCNHNLRYKSFKQNLYEKFTNLEWRDCDATNTLDELIRKGYRILNSHYMDNFMNDPTIYEDEMKQKMYERFRFLGDVHSIEYYAVKRELRALIKDRTMYIVAPPDTEGIDISQDNQDNQDTT